MKFEKKPLYRKVNTTARGCHHNKGNNYRYERGKKNPDEKMKHGTHRGLDFTPLFKFLLSKVGEDFDKVYSEALSRLDNNKEPIFWMIVDTNEESFRNENAFFNTLFVDSNNKLQKVNPNLTVNDFTPYCDCCTHTFNGIVIPNKKDKE